MSQQQFGPIFEPEPVPPVLTFHLPDETPVKSSQDTVDGPIYIELGGENLCSFVPQTRNLRISLHGVVNPDRAEFAPILSFVLAPNRTTISNDDLWGALYGLWLRKAEDDVTPFELSDDIEKAVELRNYLTFTGLAFSPPDAQGPSELLLMLRFIHIDASNPEHFESYQRWQNSDRVNIGWKERGPEEKHRVFLAGRLADPHIMGFIIEWGGEFAGYGEMSWVKEDLMSTYVGGLGDYDQNTHHLIGEERFRGRHRFTAVITSLKHACFLRDSRTDVVVGEPRYDLPVVPRLKLFLPQELNREFELPHKRAVYFVLRRHRFFQAATLY